MKKIVQCFLMLFSLALTQIIAARALFGSSIVPQTSTIQAAAHLEFVSSDVSLLFESGKMAVPWQNAGAITANLQIMTNESILTQLKTCPGYWINYTGILENEAISPHCRDVITVC